LCIWHAAASYRGEASVATWVFRIAHYLALSAKRKRRRWIDDVAIDTQDDDLYREVVSTHPSSLEDEVIGRLQLTRAIERLSVKHRTVLELIFVQGFSIEETAQILHIPVGTTKSRVSYARRALIALLREDELQEVMHYEK
jgi:RNA polymerase sigma-70 factor (ECF subfamily)